jgi:hypothetical protein
MTNEPTELLPCPFCGEKEELYPGYRGMGGGMPFGVDCIGCGIDFTPRKSQNAIRAWNTRTALSSPIDRNAVIRECAAVAGEHGYGIEISEWVAMTKKEHGAYACKSVEKAILALIEQEGNSHDQ